MKLNPFAPRGISEDRALRTTDLARQALSLCFTTICCRHPTADPTETKLHVEAPPIFVNDVLKQAGFLPIDEVYTHPTEYAEVEFEIIPWFGKMSCDVVVRPKGTSIKSRLMAVVDSQKSIEVRVEGDICCALIGILVHRKGDRVYKDAFLLRERIPTHDKLEADSKPLLGRILLSFQQHVVTQIYSKYIHIQVTKPA